MNARILVLGCLSLAALPAHSAVADWRDIPFTEPETLRGLCARGDSLWVAYDGGVRISANGGATWSETGTGFRPGKVTGVAAGRGHLAACQGRLLYLSGDGGLTWNARDSLETGNFSRMDAWDDTLFAWHALFGASSPAGVRFSVDDGLTWSPLPAAGMPLPKPRIFAADTFSFASGTLYRVNSDGPKAIFAFPGPIQEFAPTAGRVFVLSDSLIWTADQPEGPWTRVRTRNVPGLKVLGVAADSDDIALQTPMGISYSRNRGRDWTFLRSNIASLYTQSLHLGGGILYVRRGPTDDSPRRYSFADGKWDSLALPPIDFVAHRIFAARGNRVAWFAPTNYQTPEIFLSRDGGAHFQNRGKAPRLTTGWLPNLALGEGSEMAYVDASYLRRSTNDGADWDSTGDGRCTRIGLPRHIALGDSGLFLFEDGLWRLTPGPKDCGLKLIPIPAEPAQRENWNSQQGSILAASGGSVYLGGNQGLRVWEEPGTTGRIVTKPRPVRPRGNANGSHPVRVWSLPDSPAPGSHPFDARGAARHPERGSSARRPR